MQDQEGTDIVHIGDWVKANIKGKYNVSEGQSVKIAKWVTFEVGRRRKTSKISIQSYHKK